MFITPISLWTVALEKFFSLSSKIFQGGDLKHWYLFSLKLLGFTKLFLMFRRVWIRKIKRHMISHKCLTAEELLVAFIKVSFISSQWYSLYTIGTRIPSFLMKVRGRFLFLHQIYRCHISYSNSLIWILEYFLKLTIASCFEALTCYQLEMLGHNNYDMQWHLWSKIKTGLNPVKGQ